MSNKSYDVAVIGLGAMGSAAAYQLSKDGLSVLGLDRFSAVHNLGSSHGDSRITRQALGEGTCYVPLALRANEIWRELEAKSGEDLLTQCGSLVTSFGERACEKGDFFQITLASAKLHEIPHEVFDCEALRKRFPQFLFKKDEVGYFEPAGGFLRPESCIAVQRDLACKSGADFLFNTQVKEITPLPSGGVKIATAGREYEAGRAIVSVGSWVHEFLSEAYRGVFSIHRQVLYWFEPEGSYAAFSPTKCPVYIRIGDTQAEELYGFPAIDGRGEGLKMAPENFTAATSVEELSREVTEEEKVYAFAIASRYIALKPKCIRSNVCVYTSTRDHDFVIDEHPEFPEVLLLSPCSGHGFKHSAAIGELAASLIIGRTHAYDLSNFRLERQL